ncbi:MAG: Uncharacterised protein [Flavobacteriaceae bacterium]|nr:MAG: Uncharacterised protein [Flavobacteriaceae bacterium]
MAAPIAPHAIPYLAESKQPRGAPSPDLLGKIFSFGTFTLSNINSPVELALRDHLLCVSGVENPSIPLSTINPCILPSSFLAHTIAT